MKAVNAIYSGSNTQSSGLPSKYHYGESHVIEPAPSIALPTKIAGLIATTCAAAMITPWVINNPIPSATSISSNISQEFSILKAYATINLGSLVAKLISFVAYAPNWDGYEGVSPSSAAVDNALTFARKIPVHLSLPRPGIAGDGEVGFFWETSKLFIDVGFDGDDKYSFYAKDKDGNEFFGDDVDINDDIDIQILNLLPSV